MFRTRMNTRTSDERRFEVVEERYGNEDTIEHRVRRYIPWLVAMAITAAALVALAQGYFA